MHIQIKRILKIIVNRIFGLRFYNVPIIKNFIYSDNRLKEDLLLNENLLLGNNIDVKELKKKLELLDIDYFCPNISWHYHIFCGLSQKSNILKILEIGTGTGNFTNFLSKCFSLCNITTVDLPIKDWRQINHDILDASLENIIQQRTLYLEKNNINFVEIDSKDLLKKFKPNTFDLIFIDGDHLSPQVEHDINSAIILCKNKGIICVDDIIMSENKKNKINNMTSAYLDGSNYVDSASYQHLKELKQLQTSYFNKRVRRLNYKARKFISLSVVNKN